MMYPARGGLDWVRWGGVIWSQRGLHPLGGLYNILNREIRLFPLLRPQNTSTTLIITTLSYGNYFREAFDSIHSNITQMLRWIGYELFPAKCGCDQKRKHKLCSELKNFYVHTFMLVKLWNLLSHRQMQKHHKLVIARRTQWENSVNLQSLINHFTGFVRLRLSTCLQSWTPLWPVTTRLRMTWRNTDTLTKMSDRRVSYKYKNDCQRHCHLQVSFIII